MKTTALLGMVLCLNIGISMTKAQSITNSGQTQDFVYAGQATYYEYKSSNGIDPVNLVWHVTNGSFEQGSTLDTKTTSGTSLAVVYWGNPEGINGQPPKGQIKAAMVFKDRTIESNTITQKIISLKGLLPPNLEVSSPIRIVNNTPSIKFGEQNINVRLSDNFILPYLRTTFVEDYEWTLPQDWIDQVSNKTNIIRNRKTSMSIVTDKIKNGIIKLRGVGRFYEEDKSNYSTLIINRYLDWISPTNLDLKYGLQQEITYTVDAINGVTYEWQYPVGWTEKSKSGNSITLIKSPCATSADVKVRIHAGSNVS